MRRFVPVRWLILVQAAAAGLFAGHSFDYWILFPDDGHRRALLDLTGHGYLSTGATIGVVAALSAIVATFALGLSRRADKQGIGSRALALRLGAVQSASFLTIEIAERISAGAPLGGIAWRVIALGLVIQAVVAGFIAFLLTLFERAGAIVAAILARPPAAHRPGFTVKRRPGRAAIHWRLFDRPLQSRAPPIAVASR